MRSPAAADRPLPRIAVFGVAAAYGLLGLWTWRWATLPGDIVLLWPGAGLGLAATVWLGRPALWAASVGHLGLHLALAGVAPVEWGVGAASGAALAAGLALGAAIARRWAGFGSPRAAGLALAAAVATAASVPLTLPLLAAVGRSLPGWGELGAAMAAVAVGSAIVAPALDCWRIVPLDASAPPPRDRPQRFWEGWAVGGAALAIAGAAFWGDRPVAFALLPLGVGAALRLGSRFAGGLVFGMAALAAAGTARGIGPFAGPDPLVSALAFQGAAGLAAATVWGVLAWRAARDREYRALQAQAASLSASLADRERALAAARTEQQRAERDLQRARETAEAIGRSKRDFLANISHELRTPLNGILGHAQILQRKAELAPWQAELDALAGCGHRLLAIVEDVLAVLELEDSSLQLRSVPFSPRRWFEELAAASRPQVERKGLAFRCQVSDRLPTLAIADPVRLHRAALALVDNAVKFTDRGSVAIALTAAPLGAESGAASGMESGAGSGADSGGDRAMAAGRSEATEVTSAQTSAQTSAKTSDAGFGKSPGEASDKVSGGPSDRLDRAVEAADAPRARLRLSVTDTGAGLDPTAADRLFRPFERGVDSLAGIPGTGLGLAVVERIVRRMGGRVGFESSPGAGSCFWIELVVPLARAEWTEGAPAAIAAPSPSAAPPPLRPTAEELAPLREAADIGDIASLREAALALSQRDRRYGPFAQKLQDLAAAFDDRAIAQLLGASSVGSGGGRSEAADSMPGRQT